MKTKILKGYVPHLHTRINYKSITVHNKSKGGDLIIVSKRSFHFNKQNKLRQTKNNEIKRWI